MIESSLTAEPDQEGIRFRFTLPDHSGPPDAFPLGDDTTDHASAAIQLLETLWYEDRLAEDENSYVLPHQEVFDLEPVARRQLGLPGETTAVDIELRTDNYAGTEDFEIRPVVRLPGTGIITRDQRTGPFLDAAGELWLVDRDSAALLEELDRGPGSEISDQFLHIGRVSKLADRAGASLDEYLSNQYVEVPEGIAVEAEAVAPDEIQLQPVAVGAEEFDLGRGKTPPTHFEEEGGERHRLVLTEEQQESADEVKRRGRIQGTDVPRFLDNPEAFLPDEIDLDLFSLRVKGVVPRRYNSQPYVELEQGDSRDWFDASVEIDTLEVDPPEPGEAGPGRPPEGPGKEGAAPGPAEEGAGTPDLSPETYAELCEEVIDSGDRYVQHGDSWVEIDPERARAYLDAWGQLEPGERDEFQVPRSGTEYVLDVISNVDQLEFVEEEEEDGRPDPLDQVPEYPNPELFDGTLRSYQELGYSWLRYLDENDYGGLLADDMGLGKTIQVIAIMAYLAEHDRLAPTLLVVPAAVMDNWHEEIEKFCPAINHIYHHRGTNRTKDPARLQMCEVVLTTYATLRRDQVEMGQVDWTLVACDEAQKVKNPTAQRTSAVKAMKASLRLALTGTPVENGLSELWCIVDFAQPGKLGSRKEFREEFERPIQEGAETQARRMELATRLQERLTPHYVRRVKEDVLEELPPRKPDQRMPVPLSPSQKQQYARVRNAVREGDTIALAGLQNLIQVCSHPDLYLDRMRSTGELVERCPKLARSLEVVRDVQQQDEKVLIYTQYRHMQRILQECLRARFDVHAPVLNGEVRTGRRHRRVQQFNDEPGFGAMILSPEAAGVGLNITGANHVIHYTRLWNPAKENQATDRVYRIGQDRAVQVYYPIVQGDGFKSVEEHLDELLEEKRKLAKDVVWPREDLSVSGDMQSWLEESPDA